MSCKDCGKPATWAIYHAGDGRELGFRKKHMPRRNGQLIQAINLEYCRDHIVDHAELAHQYTVGLVKQRGYGSRSHYMVHCICGEYEATEPTLGDVTARYRAEHYEGFTTAAQ